MTWSIEMFPNSCLPVGIYSSPVLRAPISAWSGVSYHAYILWCVFGPASFVFAGDGVDHITVLAGDALLDLPCLSSGRASVGLAVLRVDAAQAAGLATPPEPLVGPPTCPFSPVDRWQLGLHQVISQVWRPLVGHHRGPG